MSGTESTYAEKDYMFAGVTYPASMSKKQRNEIFKVLDSLRAQLSDFNLYDGFMAGDVYYAQRTTICVVLSKLGLTPAETETFLTIAEETGFSSKDVYLMVLDELHDDALAIEESQAWQRSAQEAYTLGVDLNYDGAHDAFFGLNDIRTGESFMRTIKDFDAYYGRTMNEIDLLSAA